MRCKFPRVLTNSKISNSPTLSEIQMKEEKQASDNVGKFHTYIST